MVNLSGSAESHQDKLAIEKATLGTSGVIGVLNEMKVKPCTTLVLKQPLGLELPKPPFLHALAAPETTAKPYSEAAAAWSKY